MKIPMTFTSKMGRIVSDRRARQLVGIAGGLAILTIAQPAWADGTSIETGITTFKAWLLGISSAVGAIAVMFVGYAKLTGRMEWGRAVTVLIGIGIIFSAVTIVGWMGGSGS